MTSPFSRRPASNQCLDGRERGRVAGLHVRDADPIDEVIVDQPAPGIDRPALGRRVGVEVAVEEQARGPAGAAPDADGIDAVALDGLQVCLEPHAAHDLDHPLDEGALARRLGIALVAHHLGDDVEAGALVNAAGEREGFLVQGVVSLGWSAARSAVAGAGTASSSARV